MKLPESQLVRVCTQRQNVVGRTCGWQSGAIKICWQHSTEAGAGVEALLCGRQSRQHFGAVEGAYPGPGKSSAAGEDVVSDVVSIRPNAELRIIRKITVTVIEGIPVIRAGRICACRHCYAFQIRRGRNRKLSNDPAVSNQVILHDPITLVVGLTTAPEAQPRRVNCDSSKASGPTFIEDCKFTINNLYDAW